MFNIVTFLQGFSNAGTIEQNLEHQKILKAARLECEATLHLSEDDVKKHGTGVSNDATKCLPKCIFSKLGIFDETIGFHVDRTVETFDHALNGKLESIREKVIKCADKNLQSADACEWAQNGFKCFIEEHLSLG